MNNIPIFPEFRKIDLITEEEIKLYTDKFLPYSDYNYIELYTYGLGCTRISNLNNNLVILSEDILDEDLFISFIGINNINKTVDILLQETVKRNIVNELRLIPEISIENLDSNKFDIILDGDNHDYIISSEKIYNYIGTKLRNKKNLLNRFIKNNPNINISYSYNNNQVISLFDKWSYSKHKVHTDIEKIAIINLLNSEKLHYNYVGISIGDKLISFFVYEIDKDYCILHFIKYDTSYIGLCAFIYKLLAEKALNNNCKIINIEQDLGIEGLREAKKQLCPISYLKKYIIRRYDKMSK